MFVFIIIIIYCHYYFCLFICGAVGLALSPRSLDEFVFCYHILLHGILKYPVCRSLKYLPTDSLDQMKLATCRLWF